MKIVWKTAFHVENPSENNGEKALLKSEWQTGENKGNTLVFSQLFHQVYHNVFIAFVITFLLRFSHKNITYLFLCHIYYLQYLAKYFHKMVG